MSGDFRARLLRRRSVCLPRLTGQRNSLSVAKLGKNTIFLVNKRLPRLQEMWRLGEKWVKARSNEKVGVVFIHMVADFLPDSTSASSTQLELSPEDASLEMQLAMSGADLARLQRFIDVDSQFWEFNLIRARESQLTRCGFCVWYPVGPGGSPKRPPSWGLKLQSLKTEGDKYTL